MSETYDKSEEFLTFYEVFFTILKVFIATCGDEPVLFLPHSPSWCDLDLTFDLAVVTLTYKILSGLYLGNCKV